jgi:hypothetical protein
MSKKSKKYQSALFPDISTTYRSNTYPERFPETPYITPFDLQTGVLTAGVHAGKTLDDVFRLDPGYVMRFVYYWHAVWSRDHQAAFIYWTRNINI